MCSCDLNFLGEITIFFLFPALFDVRKTDASLFFCTFAGKYHIRKTAKIIHSRFNLPTNRTNLH